MSGLLIITGAVGVLAATAALLLQRRRRFSLRSFAALVALAVGSSLFSVCGWVATLLAGIVSILLAWGLIGMLSLLLARRVYRELQVSQG